MDIEQLRQACVTFGQVQQETCWLPWSIIAQEHITDENEMYDGPYEDLVLHITLRFSLNFTGSDSSWSFTCYFRKNGSAYINYDERPDMYKRIDVTNHAYHLFTPRKLVRKGPPEGRLELESWKEAIKVIGQHLIGFKGIVQSQADDLYTAAYPFTT